MQMGICVRGCKEGGDNVWVLKHSKQRDWRCERGAGVEDALRTKLAVKHTTAAPACSGGCAKWQDKLKERKKELAPQV
jgi:hypothetical protein